MNKPIIRMNIPNGELNLEIYKPNRTIIEKSESGFNVTYCFNAMDSNGNINELEITLSNITSEQLSRTKNYGYHHFEPALIWDFILKGE